MIYIELIITLVLALIFITSYIFYSNFKSNKKLKEKLELSFGKIPENDFNSIDSIENFHISIEQNKNEHFVDDMTWNDLDMDSVFCRINSTCTSIGEEYLYHILHKPSFSQESLNNREEFIEYLKQKPDFRLNLQFYLSKLGKRNYNGLWDLVNSENFENNKFNWLYKFLSITPIVSIGLIFLNFTLGIILLVLSFIINMTIHYAFVKNLDFELSSLEYFSSMLWTCNKINALKNSSLKKHLPKFENNYNIFKSLAGKISLMTKKEFSDGELLSQYLRIMFLMDINNYNKTVSKISKNVTSFNSLYKDFGEIDACISVLSFRESLDYFCTPNFSNKNAVDMRDLFHPLLKNPVSNDVLISNNSIITGSNASGKSTFIKAVAINGILSQTINTCTASYYCTRFSFIISSMAVKDDLVAGDSYFVTEVKSIKRIVDIASEVHCMCFIDEILKGTNTIERIAASVAILKSLSKLDCLCLVASHDMELTEILGNLYDNYHFSENFDLGGINFDYTIKEGVSKTTNAIKLLEYFDFDKTLTQNANVLVDKFLSTGKWI